MGVCYSSKQEPKWRTFTLTRLLKVIRDTGEQSSHATDAKEALIERYCVHCARSFLLFFSFNPHQRPLVEVSPPFFSMRKLRLTISSWNRECSIPIYGLDLRKVCNLLRVTQLMNDRAGIRAQF